MASIVIRKLDESLKSRLRIRAAEHGRSMEEEAREILKTGLNREGGELNIVDAIRRHVEPLGGIELSLPSRDAVRPPPKFKK
jgi:plasmid stability protein